MSEGRGSGNGNPGSFCFQVEAVMGAARAGMLELPHGSVATPAFMPVGTHGAVRGLHPDDVRRTGAQIVLGNTYHLHLRPGEDVVRALGGLHRFSTWAGPLLTDSGGFQVFSLETLRTISEHGVEFQSHIDGSWRTITPEARGRSRAPAAPTSRCGSTTWYRDRRATSWPGRVWSGA